MNTPINTPVLSCILNPTTEQANILTYNTAVSSFISDYLEDAKKKEYFGKPSKAYYNKVNNLYYLLMYISVINDQRQIDINNGLDNPCSYYSANFICIVNYFKCLNINILPLLSIFNLNCIVPCTGPQGIGYSVIYDDGSDQNPCTIFIIQ